MSERSDEPLNLDFLVIEIEEIHIGSWTPERDGEGTPEQVHVMLKTSAFPTPLYLRLKTRETLQMVVDNLLFHADHVWPEEENK